jgi:hypothetical protein
MEMITERGGFDDAIARMAGSAVGLGIEVEAA